MSEPTRGSRLQGAQSRSRTRSRMGSRGEVAAEHGVHDGRDTGGTLRSQKQVPKLAFCSAQVRWTRYYSNLQRKGQTELPTAQTFQQQLKATAPTDTPPACGGPARVPARPVRGKDHSGSSAALQGTSTHWPVPAAGLSRRSGSRKGRPLLQTRSRVWPLSPCG